MKIKVSEATPLQLDWLVAKCEEPHDGYLTGIVLRDGEVKYHPTTDWNIGGPILEREGISVAKVGRSLEDAIAPHLDCWCAHIDGVYTYYAPTPLIAALRCFLASRLGEEVEIPKELV